ncbi:peptidylprolyl isomerase [Motilimonas eburnea]|uniref:peptidylprolyl isomerase n=1 Tax=Motilimonas eburnea TaxID=1737488 RepID=UPI001E38F85B|nr:peptidylprolyl isomerase [Motilimonas eburnea]MCE2572821.1 peptidylprolyl isomerase [Motilimonas eburnea]
MLRTEVGKAGKLVKVMAALALSLSLAACSDEGVVAKVGDVEVTQSSFELWLSIQNSAVQALPQEQALQQYLEQLALSQAVIRRGEVDLDKIQAQAASYQQHQLISQQLQLAVADEVSDEAIAKLYGQRVNELTQTKRKLAHILIRVPQEASDAERLQAKNRAEEAYSKLDTGADFAEIVLEYSEDERTKQQGGELGWVGKEQAEKASISQAFSLETGQYSLPIATKYGFHIVTPLSAEQAFTPTLEELKGKLSYELKQQIRQQTRQQLLSEVSIERVK